MREKMLNVISVDYPFSNSNVTNISFFGKETFLDADVLIIDPSAISLQIANESKQVRDFEYHCVESSSFRIIHDKISKRQEEISKLLQAGKIIISFLPSCIKLYNPDPYNFEVLSNYSWAPYTPQGLDHVFINGNGKLVILKNNQNPFSSYFLAFKNELQYFVHWNYRNDADPEILFLNNAGFAVGWRLKAGLGVVYFLPPPPQSCNKEKVYGVLIQVAKKNFNELIVTPEPIWAKTVEIPGVNIIEQQLTDLQQKIDDLNDNQSKFLSEKQELLNYKFLLYENGKNLENAVIGAFRLMGFVAEPYVKDDMEHDVILTSAEGRAIAEIEGKDKEAIHIEKMDQLNREVDEDFKEHKDFAQGILIGNPYRLLPVDQRKDPFTEKVKIFVKKKNFKLLTTVELFNAVIYILKNPRDEEYKQQCRKKMFENPGEEIKF